MTIMSISQARALGIIPGPRAKPKNQTRPSGIQWDAKTFPGGVWIQVPFVPPSLNIWKWHRAKQGRYKKDLTAAIRGLVLALKLPRYRRATVQVVYYCRTNRRRDPADNWAPKFLMDALVAGGILVDDNGDLVDVAPMKIDYDPIKPRTEIFVWERR